MDESQKEKVSTILSRPWELFGFGCHYAWIAFLVIDPRTFEGMGSGDEVMLLRVILAGAIAVCYAATLFTSRVLKAPVPTRFLVVGGGIAGTAGTLLLLVPVDGAARVCLWIIAAAAIGFSYVLSMAMGNLFWTKNRSERAVMQLTVSNVVAVVVFALLSVMPHMWAVVLASALPLAGDIVLAMSKGGKRRSEPYSEKPTASRDRIRMAVGSFAYMFAYGVIVGCPVVGHGSLEFLVIGLGLGAIVSLLVAMRCAPAEWMGIVDRLSMPALLLGCAGVACFASEQGGIASFFKIAAISGVVFSDHFFWIVNADMAYRDRKGLAQAIVEVLGLMQWLGFYAGEVVAFVCAGVGEARIAVFFAFVLVLLSRTVAFYRDDAIRLIYGRETGEVDDAHELRCAKVAKLYSLSPRETEVFMLLAQGRTGTYIQEQLVLSQSTVKTHTRSIYRKLNVGDRQEMLDLIQQTKL